MPNIEARLSVEMFLVLLYSNHVFYRRMLRSEYRRADPNILFIEEMKRNLEIQNVT